MNQIQPRLKAVLELLDGLKVKNIKNYLDIGCGDGYFTYLISLKLGASEVYGVDINKERLALAGEKGIKCFLVDLNTESLPLPNNSVDVVTSLEVIEHLINPDNMLQEVHRVLKPTGYLIITTPNLASYINRGLLLFGFQPTYLEVSTEFEVPRLLGHKNLSKPSGHLRLYTLNALKFLLKMHHFEIVRVKGSTSTYSIPKPVRFMDKIIGSLSPSLARIIIIVAKKRNC